MGRTKDTAVELMAKRVETDRVAAMTVTDFVRLVLMLASKVSNDGIQDDVADSALAQLSAMVCAAHLLPGLSYIHVLPADPGYGDYLDGLDRYLGYYEEMDVDPCAWEILHRSMAALRETLVAHGG